MFLAYVNIDNVLSPFLKLKSDFDILAEPLVEFQSRLNLLSEVVLQLDQKIDLSQKIESQTKKFAEVLSTSKPVEKAKKLYDDSGWFRKEDFQKNEI
jgi:hypothetical protein